MNRDRYIRVDAVMDPGAGGDGSSLPRLASGMAIETAVKALSDAASARARPLWFARQTVCLRVRRRTVGRDPIPLWSPCPKEMPGGHRFPQPQDRCVEDLHRKVLTEALEPGVYLDET